MTLRFSRSPEKRRLLPVISPDITASLAEQISERSLNTPKTKTIRLGSNFDQKHLTTEQSRLVEQTLRIRLQQAGHIGQQETGIASSNLRSLVLGRSTASQNVRATTDIESLRLPPLPPGCRVIDGPSELLVRSNSLATQLRSFLRRDSGADKHTEVKAQPAVRRSDLRLQEFIRKFPQHLQPAVSELAKGVYALTPDEIEKLVQPLDWKTRKLILMTSATRTANSN